MNKKEFELSDIQYDAINKIGLVTLDSEQGPVTTEPAMLLEGMSKRQRAVFLMGYLQSMNNRFDEHNWEHILDSIETNPNQYINN